jgi:hypothetical protein
MPAMLSRILPLSLVLAAILSSSADAQRRYAWRGGYGYGYGGYNGASTVQESWDRGIADKVRAYGQYQLKNSEAAKNYADARSMEMDNRYKYTQMYFDLKKINKAQRAELAGPPPTAEQLIRYAQAGAPKKLSNSELDPFTGKVEWPRALTTEEYAADRAKIEKLFSERALQNGQVNEDQFTQIHQVAHDLETTLKDNIDKYDTTSYLAAKNFLGSLAHEVR